MPTAVGSSVAQVALRQLFRQQKAQQEGAVPPVTREAVALRQLREQSEAHSDSRLQAEGTCDYSSEVEI
jgi:hypothetical protein